MASEPEHRRTLLVKNLNPYISEARVQDIFKALGPVKSVRLVRDKGLNVGAAYVTYEEQSAATQAVSAIDGQEICGKAVRIGWAPQEDLLAEPQGAAASQDGTQPAPLAWTASDGAPPIPGPPVPAWGTPTGGSAAAPAEPAVATGGVPTSLPQTCLGFPALSLAERPQGPGAPRKAARGGDPAANPEQGHAASGLGPAAGGGGAAPARFHVFVGNLPGDASDAALLDAFRGLPVLEARVMRDHATGRSKGFGFLGFPTQESAAQAIVLMNGVYLGHNRMRCSWATQKQEPTLGDVNAAKVHMSAPGNTNVYVGNLPVEVDEAELVRHFAPFGAVVAVKLCLKGCFGFVHFRDHAAAVAAICAMNGRPIHGKPVKCAWGRCPALPAGGAAKAAGVRNPDFDMNPNPNLHPALSVAAAAQQAQLQAMAALRLGVVGGMGGAQGVSLPAMCQAMGLGLGLPGGMPFAGQQGAALQQGLFGGQLGYACQGFGAQGGGHLGPHAAALYPGGLAAGLNGLGHGGMGAPVSRPMGAHAFARAGNGLADTFAALHAYKASMGGNVAACDPNIPVMNPNPGSFSLAAAWGEIGQARALDAAQQAAALGLLPNGLQGAHPYPNPMAPQLHAQAPVHAQKPQMFAM